MLPGVSALGGRNFPVLAGNARRENTAIYVTRGVGTVYVPVRINCPPEVAILTLRPHVGEALDGDPEMASSRPRSPA